MNPGSPCRTSELDSVDDYQPDERSRMAILSAGHSLRSDSLCGNWMMECVAAEYVAQESVIRSHAVRDAGGPI
jgi:hypothetical protein